jgi:glycosyltransferase involved in cell wall biosynthesis
VGRDSKTAPGGATWAEYAEARHPELAGRFEIRSGVADEQLAALYGEATLLLCTSLYESFGLTLVEGMFAGLAVVAPATAAMGEVVRDGETGWLYPAESPDRAQVIAELVFRVLTDPVERDRVVAHAVEIARAEYSAELMATRMLEVYRHAATS